MSAPPVVPPSAPGSDDVKFVAREGSWAGILGGLGAAVRYVNSILLARVLGSAAYGLWALANTVVMLLAMPANMGLPVSAVHFVASSAARGEWTRVRRVVATALRIVALSSLAFTVVVVLAAPWAARALFHKPGLVVPLVGLALALPLLGFNAVCGGALQGLKAIRAKVIVDRIAHPVVFSVLLAAGFAWMRLTGRPLGMRAVLLAFVAVAGLVAALGAWWLRGGLAALPAAGGERGIAPRELLAYATPVMLLNLLNHLLLWLDVLVMGVYRSAAEVGIYHVAVRLGTAVNMPTEALNTSLAPSYAGQHGKGDAAGLRRTFHTSTRWIFTLSAAIALGVVFGGRPLLRLFGSDFAQGHLALALVALGQLASAAMGTNGMFLTMTGHPKVNLANAAAMVVVSGVLNLMLVPRYGAVGAAAAAAAALAAINALRCVEIWVLFRTLPWDRTILKPFGAFVIAAAGGGAVFAALGGIPAALVALGLFAGSWWLSRPEPEDLDLVRRALAKLRPTAQ